jgi:hypothetical protein
MDQKQFIKFVAKRCAKNIKTIRAKDHDYATPDNPFWNISLCEVFGLCSTEVGILVRFLDKVARICNMINWAPAVKDETRHDTIADAHGYLHILDAYLTSQEELEEDIEYLRSMDLVPDEGEIMEEPTLELDFSVLRPSNSRYAAERGGGEGI